MRFEIRDLMARNACRRDDRRRRVSMTNWIDDRDDEFIDLFRCAANELRSVRRGGKIDLSERGVFRQSIKKVVLRAAFFHFGAIGLAMAADHPAQAFATTDICDRLSTRNTH
jgi:hypothetical protein